MAPGCGGIIPGGPGGGGMPGRGAGIPGPGTGGPGGMPGAPGGGGMPGRTGIIPGIGGGGIPAGPPHSNRGQQQQRWRQFRTLQRRGLLALTSLRLRASRGKRRTRGAGRRHHPRWGATTAAEGCSGGRRHAACSAGRADAVEAFISDVAPGMRVQLASIREHAACVPNHTWPRRKGRAHAWHAGWRPTCRAEAQRSLYLQENAEWHRGSNRAGGQCGRPTLPLNASGQCMHVYLGRARQAGAAHQGQGIGAAFARDQELICDRQAQAAGGGLFRCCSSKAWTPAPIQPVPSLGCELQQF